MTFEETMSRATERYAEGEHAEALELVLAADAPPGWIAIRTLLEVNLRCMLGERDRTVEVLAAGLERGEWWRPEMLANDPDFEMVRQDPRFGAVLAEARASHRVERVAFAGFSQGARIAL